MKKRYMLVGLLVLMLVVAMTAVACGGEEETTTTAAPARRRRRHRARKRRWPRAPTHDRPEHRHHDRRARLPANLSRSGSPTASPGSRPLRLHRPATAWPSWSEIVNANGGITGRPLEVIMLDDKSDVPPALANINKLIQEDKVAATVGPFAQFMQEPARAIAEQTGTPMVGMGPATLEQLAATTQYQMSVMVSAAPPTHADALDQGHQGQRLEEHPRDRRSISPSIRRHSTWSPRAARPKASP